MNTVDLENKINDLFMSCNNCMCKYILPNNGWGCFDGECYADGFKKFHKPIKTKDQIKADLCKPEEWDK